MLELHNAVLEIDVTRNLPISATKESDVVCGSYCFEEIELRYLQLPNSEC